MTAPELYLRNAEALLRTPVQGARGIWPRACGWLLRLALEASLDEYWQRADPAVAACRNRRAQILMLNSRLEPALVHQIGYLWWALSRLAHHRGYELAPTARELRYLRDSVRKATHDLSQATASRTGTGTRSG